MKHQKNEICSKKNPFPFSSEWKWIWKLIVDPVKRAKAMRGKKYRIEEHSMSALRCSLMLKVDFFFSIAILSKIGNGRRKKNAISFCILINSSRSNRMGFKWNIHIFKYDPLSYFRLHGKNILTQYFSNKSCWCLKCSRFCVYIVFFSSLVRVDAFKEATIEFQEP